MKRSGRSLEGPVPFSTLRSDFRLGDSYDPTVKTFQNDANGNLTTQTDPKGPGFRYFSSLNQMRIASTDSAPLQLYRVGTSGRTAEFRTNGVVFGGIVQTIVGGNRTILELGPAGGVSISGGVGSPEGVITAAVGSLWLRTDAGPWSKIYSKEEGSGNTGWGS